jgi:hypothetical protein
MGSLPSSPPGGSTADSTSSLASCDWASVSVFGEDDGTSTVPVRRSVEAILGDFAASTLIAVASNFGDAGPKIFVLDCDCGAVASILLGPVCGVIG